MSTRPKARLVGVLHLPPLPGSPRAELSTRVIAERAAREAASLHAAGFDLAILENFGDAPFHRGAVEPITIAAMTACAIAVRERAPDLPIGINVLRNDAAAALAIAHAVGAACIRVNVLTGARVTDQGIVEGDAASLLRLRRHLGAEAVQIWADVDVKHSAALAPRSFAAECKDTRARALADALLVTGEGTGEKVDESRLAEARVSAGGAPVLAASGTTVESLPLLARGADGVIVGSALRADGRAGGPVDEKRAAEFAAAFRRAFG